MQGSGFRVSGLGFMVSGHTRLVTTCCWEGRTVASGTSPLCVHADANTNSRCHQLLDPLLRFFFFFLGGGGGGGAEGILGLSG